MSGRSEENLALSMRFGAAVQGEGCTPRAKVLGYSLAPVDQAPPAVTLGPSIAIELLSPAGINLAAGYPVSPVSIAREASSAPYQADDAYQELQLPGRWQRCAFLHVDVCGLHLPSLIGVGHGVVVAVQFSGTEGTKLFRGFSNRIAGCGEAGPRRRSTFRLAVAGRTR